MLPKRSLRGRYGSPTLAALAAVMAACGEATPVIDPDSHGEPTAGYSPPAPGCPPGSRSATLPALDMPWAQGPEVYLPGPSAIPGMALDYDVVPLATVSFVRSEFLFDSVPRAPIEIDGACPAELPASAWTATSVSNDVVWARIEMGAPQEASRFAWIGYPVGEHSLTLDLAGVPAAERTGSFFVVFAPSTGRQRIAVRAVTVTPSSGDILAVGGLPDVAGHVALIRSRAVSPIDDGPALRAATGFSKLWATSAELWYGALVTAGEIGTVPLQRFRSADEAAVWSSPYARDVAPPDATPVRRAAVRLLPFGPGLSGRDLEVACDGLTEVQAPFEASMTISADGNETPVVPGSVHVIDPSCSGSTATTAHVRIESNTHSGLVVVRGS